MKQIINFCTSLSSAEVHRFREIISSPSTYLFFNERMVNLPVQLIAPMYATLAEDVEKAKLAAVRALYNSPQLISKAFF